MNPPIPPEADMRGLQFMPLDVVRLMDSDLFALSTGNEFKAAVALWCKAWLQFPAASLPDDDRVLAHLSGAGSGWKKVKEMALRGFVKCSDGRLYHPVIAEKARDAWEMRLRQRDRSAKGNAKRWGQQKTSFGDPHGDPHGDPCAIPRDRDRDRDREENTKILETSQCGLVASETAPRKAKRARPRSGIDENFQPDEKHKSIAGEYQLSSETFRVEWRKFRAYHTAKGSLMANWHAAWRTWCEGMGQFQARAGPSQNDRSQPRGHWKNLLETSERMRHDQQSESPLGDDFIARLAGRSEI